MSERKRAGGQLSVSPPDISKLSPKTEYILVTDKTSKILKSTTDWYEVVKQANFIRRAGGEVTIFKSTKG